MPKVLKVMVIDAAKAAQAMDLVPKTEGKLEITLGLLPDKVSMMQCTPEGRVMIFYVEEEDGAQG